MVDLPARATRLAVGSVVRSALPWGLPFVGLISSPWLAMSAGAFDIPSVRTIAVAFLLPVVVAVVVVVRFPHERLGTWAIDRIRHAGAIPSTRVVNLTDQLAVATGTYGRYDVVTVDSPIPNVAALPAAGGAHVVVTTGAERMLDRDALEALIASQIVVVSEPWVRLASGAQLVGSLRFALLFGSGFLNPVLIPFAFLAFWRPRRADTVRDMLADATAVQATRHPDALARALYAMRPAAGLGNRLRVGVPGFLVDQFWVLSTRSTVTTTVSTPTSQRRWTTREEIAAEMALRSDRVRRAAQGDERALFDVQAWRTAVGGLGTAAVTPSGLPIPLTAEEEARAEQIAAALD